MVAQYPTDMKDIVEAALANAESYDSDVEVDSTEFGEPEIHLVGYGETGADIIQEGLDSPYPASYYPDVETHHIQHIDEPPANAIDADYAILVGSADEHVLATGIGDVLSDNTTSIAIPIDTAESPARTVGTVNATVPCTRSRVQAGVTVILVILMGHTEISPPPRFYQELQSIGRMQGFRGEQARTQGGSSPAQFAKRLVTEALSNPFGASDSLDAEHFISFLEGGEELTLEEVEAVRDELSDAVGASAERELVAVEVTEHMESRCRLTVLCR